MSWLFIYILNHLSFCTSFRSSTPMTPLPPHQSRNFIIFIYFYLAFQSYYPYDNANLSPPPCTLLRFFILCLLLFYFMLFYLECDVRLHFSSFLCNLTREFYYQFSSTISIAEVRSNLCHISFLLRSRRNSFS